MLTTVAIAGVGTVLAVLFTLSRVIGWRLILKHATLVDIGFSVLMLGLYAGTAVGMLTAVWAGLFMCIVLFVVKGFVRVIGEAKVHANNVSRKVKDEFAKVVS